MAGAGRRQLLLQLLQVALELRLLLGAQGR
jgi:hypothetical protein